MPLLAIDFGETRIGLALSVPDGNLVVPLETFERKSDRKALGKIAEVARDHGVTALVLGDPVHVDGCRGEASERVRRFAAKLEEKTGLPIHWVPETLTSNEARRRLRDAGVDVAKEPERLDAVAAQIILEEFLRREPPGTNLAE